LAGQGPGSALFIAFIPMSFSFRITRSFSPLTYSLILPMFIFLYHLFVIVCHPFNEILKGDYTIPITVNMISVRCNLFREL